MIKKFKDTMVNYLVNTVLPWITLIVIGILAVSVVVFFVWLDRVRFVI